MQLLVVELQQHVGLLRRLQLLSSNVGSSVSFGALIGKGLVSACSKAGENHRLKIRSSADVESVKNDQLLMKSMTDDLQHGGPA